MNRLDTVLETLNEVKAGVVDPQALEDRLQALLTANLSAWVLTLFR